MNPTDVAFALAALAGTTAAGRAVVRLFDDDLSGRERVAWSMSAGVLLLAGASGILMAAGLTPGPKKLAAALLFMAGACLALRRRASGLPRRAPQGSAVLASALVLLSLALVGLFAIESVRGGMWASEHVAIWGLKAKSIFATGSFPARIFRDPALAEAQPGYPLLVPVTLAALAAALRSWNPHALALLDPFFELATVLVVSGFLARRVSRLAGAAGGLLVAACAALYSPGNVGTAQIPIALGFALSATAWLDCLEDAAPGAAARLLLGSLVCVTTRPEGMIWVIALLVALAARRPLGKRRGRAALALFVALAGAAAAFLWMRSAGPPRPFPDLSPLLDRGSSIAPRILVAAASGAPLLLAALALLLLFGSAGVGDALLLPVTLQILGVALLAAFPDSTPFWRAEDAFGRSALLLFPVVALVAAARALAPSRTSPQERSAVLSRASSASVSWLAALLLLLAVVPSALRGMVGESRIPSWAVAHPTFHASVEPILQAHCQTCHRQGGIAPFALRTYEDASSQSRAIRRQVSGRHMPPWRALSGCKTFSNDPSLTESQIATIVRWVDSGSPEGNAKDAPPPPVFADGWQLGKPDLVLKAPVFTPDFSKGDLYQCFVLPTNLEENAWISAVEVKPGNRGMVHHALLYVEEGIVSRDLDEAAPGPGYPCFGGPRAPVTDSFGEWAPGIQAHTFPPGTARFLPRKSRIIMQVHYSAMYGRVASDASEVGVYFAKEPITKRLLSNDVRADAPFTIPAEAVAHVLTGRLGPLDSQAELVAILPHMHLLGKTMRVTARLPDGSQQCLVDVKDWDLRWQRTYYYARPVVLPKGTVLELEATFDNSYANPNNPSEPHVDVHFGEHTTDEMCMALLFWTVDGRNPGERDAFFKGQVCGLSPIPRQTPAVTPRAR